MLLTSAATRPRPARFAEAAQWFEQVGQRLGQDGTASTGWMAGRPAAAGAQRLPGRAEGLRDRGRRGRRTARARCWPCSPQAKLKASDFAGAKATATQALRLDKTNPAGRGRARRGGRHPGRAARRAGQDAHPGGQRARRARARTPPRRSGTWARCSTATSRPCPPTRSRRRWPRCSSWRASTRRPRRWAPGVGGGLAVEAGPVPPALAEAVEATPLPGRAVRRRGAAVQGGGEAAGPAPQGAGGRGVQDLPRARQPARGVRARGARLPDAGARPRARPCPRRPPRATLPTGFAELQKKAETTPGRRVARGAGPGVPGGAADPAWRS